MNGKVIVRSHDLRHEHPLQHAAMVCVDMVAKQQGGGAWTNVARQQWGESWMTTGKYLLFTFSRFHRIV